MSSATTFFDFKPKDKKGNDYPLAPLKGKVVLVVNTASKCGFTPQFEGLEKLYKELHAAHPDFQVIGFPCNQFGGQDPGSNDEIQSFCQVNYGVTFPVLGKVDVNGDKADPVFEWLKSEKPGLMGLKRVKWNFEKFLVGKDGRVIGSSSFMYIPVQVPTAPPHQHPHTPAMPTADPTSPPALAAKIPKLIPRKRASDRAPPSAPPPPTPALPPPPDLASHTYTPPSRRILSPADHALFLASPTCNLVTGFVFGVSDSVRDRPISSLSATDTSPVVDSIVHILEDTEGILDRNPPEDTGSRFGNPIFRTFLDDVEAALPRWHAELGLRDEAQMAEISTYLHNAFGNKRRIDYGSGHELNFFLWLLCLNRLSLLPSATFPALALRVLPTYLRLMRRIQGAYYLEPAGSHGVWGLDDYQFLPFLFGASQLLHHPYITPKAIHNALVLEESRSDFLYLDQVAYVNSVKNVDGLRWHSPMLDDISSSKSWGKIEAGMRKMFVKEILEKLPVMQHFLFGSLIPAVEGMSREEDFGLGEEEEEDEGGEVRVFSDEDGKRHVHASKGWGDCCGIRVPAAVGAEGEERKGGMQRLRRVPFD
ncbi:PTPA-domain-containing protein [Karstenula rhodostoma CBS 690.94]|uniref:Multifunctional fusion protein n=1 Tax=Karstenula rhodostoma CBS 690.94 TaxID=1392251 RepID=A0A9P4PVJ6_9PLEO|nr:PTPA-domain-containing protein [Karstenula rhodostoma CBS 690.94]